MSEMQAQCWICPHCFDDHATNADCKESDLKEAVDYLKQENAELKRKLEKAVEALKWISQQTSHNENTLDEVKLLECSITKKAWWALKEIEEIK